MIDLLSQNRGDLRVRASDFLAWSKGARFYPLLYMLTRTGHAKDWDTGIELSNHLLGKLSRLEVHHIFPKALLYKNDYARQDVNALANFTFLTQETNLKVTDRDPAEYLEEFAAKNPGAIESHWIPMDRNLWRVENYHEFLAVRRQLLADAANQFLDGLFAGSISEQKIAEPVMERTKAQITGGISSAEEEDLLMEYNQWVVNQGLPEGEFLYELIDENTAEVSAVIDLAWTNGLQEGLSQPVALLIDEDKETEEIVNRAGFLFFTNFEEFQKYVKSEILAEGNLETDLQSLESNGRKQGDSEKGYFPAAQQIVPLTKANEYQGLGKAESEQNQQSGQYLQYLLFWENLLSLAKEKSHLHDYVSPSDYDYICVKNLRGLRFNHVINQYNGRVELYIDKGKVELNKEIFDELFAHKSEIEAVLGEPLSWERLDHRIASRIAFHTFGGVKSAQSEWQTIHETMIDAMISLEKALSPYLEKLKNL